MGIIKGVVLSGLVALATLGMPKEGITDVVETPLNLSTNVNFGAESGFYGLAIGKVDRVKSYKFNASADHGGEIIEGVTDGWVREGNTNRLFFSSSNGFHFLKWENVPESQKFDNPIELIADQVYSNVFGVSGTNQYSFHNYVFRDPLAGIDVTNRVTQGSHFATNFPEIIYMNDDPESGVRYKAVSYTSTGTDISTNAP